MADIERYLRIRSATAPSFSPSGVVAFLLDTTGVAQAWTLGEPGAWPVQSTHFEERVAFVDWSPTREEFAFSMDEGGNERHQLYLATASGEVARLTDRPAAKHHWGGWSSDGSRFAFASNRRDESVFDIHTQDRSLDNGGADRLVEGSGWFSVAGWSPDDTRLLVHEARSNYDHDVYALDVESRSLRHLTPNRGEARYVSLAWGPRGDVVYAATDAEGDTTSLIGIHLDSLETSLVATGGAWNVDGVEIHEETGRLVYSRNVNGYTELSTGRIQPGPDLAALPDPDLPRGVHGGVDFGPDGDRFAVASTGDTRNSNVYVVDIETGHATQWTRAGTAGFSTDDFEASRAIEYDSFDDTEIHAYLTLPQTADRCPVIVDIHGGPENQRRPGFNPVKQYFVDSGYGVFEPNVRGSTGYGKRFTRLDDKRNRLDAVEDLRAGVEWLRARDRVDPDRVVAMGASYGGFMVLASMTRHPDLWAAGVDIVGIANFVTFLENTGSWRRALREAEYGSLGEDREFLESISPLATIDRIAAPLLVIHGANDPRVPVSEADQVVERAREHVPVEKLIFEDEGHGFSKLENRITAYRTVVEFLNAHLAPPPGTSSSP